MRAAFDLKPVPRSAVPGEPGFRDIPAEPKAIVLVWPDYSSSNPYQPLLYGTNAFGVAYHFAPIETAMQLLEGNVVDVPVVFHLHWLNWLLQGVKSDIVAFRVVTDFIAKLNRFKKLGGILIWTIHNEISHEALFQEEEIALSNEIARLADAVHVHDISSLEEISSFHIPRHKVVEVPHGHYCGVYSDRISRPEARRILGYSDDDEVCLFFGMVRRYKGVEELVTAFRSLLRERPALKLLLVGRMLYDPFEKIAEPLTPEERRAIQLHSGFIADDRIQTFFRASDFAVFPYRRVLTSGSVMLSLSFGVPTAAADVAMTRTVLSSGDLGATIPDPGTAGQISGALRDLATRKSEGRTPIEPAELAEFWASYRWQDFSVKVLEPLIARYVPSRSTRVRTAMRGRSIRIDIPLEEYSLVSKADGFCETTFRRRYPLACTTSRDPVSAYLEQTRSSGLQATPSFDPAFYCTLFADAAASGIDPFVHYTKFGGAWKRPANGLEQVKHLEAFRAQQKGFDEASQAIKLFLLPTKSRLAAERRVVVIRRAIERERNVIVHAIASVEDAAELSVTSAFTSAIDGGRLIVHGRRNISGACLLHDALETARTTLAGGVAMFVDVDAATDASVVVPDDIVDASMQGGLPFLYLPEPGDTSGHVISLSSGLLDRLVPPNAPLTPDFLPELIAIRARQACPALPILGPGATRPFRAAPRAAERILADVGVWRVAANLSDQIGNSSLDREDAEGLARLFDVSDALIDGCAAGDLRQKASRENVKARVAYVEKRSDEDGVEWLFEMHSGPTRRISGSGDTVVFLCVKNDRVFLSAFINHYRAIGARHIVIVDDRSDEPLGEIFDTHDVSILRPFRGRFLTAKTLWLETLIRHFAAPDGWVVTVDADEFFDPPEGLGNLPELTRILEEAGQQFLPCLLVDMLPAVGVTPPDGRVPEDFVGLLDHICWDTRTPESGYSFNNTVKWGFGRHSRLSWQIDARFHMFGIHESLRKISLFRPGRSIHLNQGFHALLDSSGENFLTEQIWERGPIGRIRHYKYAKFISKDWHSVVGDFTGHYFEETARNMAKIIQKESSDILRQASLLPTIRYDKVDFGEFIDEIRRQTPLSTITR